jgi:hypothetical protein
MLACGIKSPHAKMKLKLQKVFEIKAKKLKRSKNLLKS